MRCPECGALNPESSPWCDQCYHRFGSTESKPPSPTGPETTDLSPIPDKTPDQVRDLGASAISEAQSNGKTATVQSRGSAQTGRSSEILLKQQDALSWKCSACDSVNSIDSNVCSTCGTSLFDMFGASSQEAPVEPRNPTTAVMLSVVPGAGHLYLGRSGEGAVRLLLSTWWFGFALLLEAPSLFFLRAIFLLAGTGLMIVSALDAYNAALDPKSIQVLDRRVILFASLGLVVLMVVGLMLAFFSASR